MAWLPRFTNHLSPSLSQVRTEDNGPKSSPGVSRSFCDFCLLLSPTKHIVQYSPSFYPKIPSLYLSSVLPGKSFSFSLSASPSPPLPLPLPLSLLVPLLSTIHHSIIPVHSHLFQSTLFRSYLLLFFIIIIIIYFSLIPLAFF